MIQQLLRLPAERLVLGRDATARIGEVGLGGALGRLDLRVDLEGDGSTVDLDGLSFGDRDQTHDYRMVIRHAGKNTSPDIFLKGAVEDRASSVFTGLLRRCLLSRRVGDLLLG